MRKKHNELKSDKLQLDEMLNGMYIQISKADDTYNEKF